MGQFYIPYFHSLKLIIPLLWVMLLGIVTPKNVFYIFLPMIKGVTQTTLLFRRRLLNSIIQQSPRIILNWESLSLRNFYTDTNATISIFIFFIVLIVSFKFLPSFEPRLRIYLN